MEKNEIEKELFYQWIHEILSQIVLSYKQPEYTGYGKLDPDHVIIDDDQNLYLAGEEVKTVHPLCIKNFMSYNVDKQECDIYNFGKTIQFILAHLNCSPVLSGREEYILLKFVRNCISGDLKTSYKDIYMLQDNLPGMLYKSGGKKRYVKIGIKCFILFMLLFMLIFSFGDVYNDINENNYETEDMYDEEDEMYY